MRPRTTPPGTLPTDGRVVIATPKVAVRMVEAEPSLGFRVFTLPGLPEDQVYVLDIDALNDAIGLVQS